MFDYSFTTLRSKSIFRCFISDFEYVWKRMNTLYKPNNMYTAQKSSTCTNIIIPELEEYCYNRIYQGGGGTPNSNQTLHECIYCIVSILSNKMFGTNAITPCFDLWFEDITSKEHQILPEIKEAEIFRKERQNYLLLRALENF